MDEHKRRLLREVPEYLRRTEKDLEELETYLSDLDRYTVTGEIFRSRDHIVYSLGLIPFLEPKVSRRY